MIMCPACKTKKPESDMGDWEQSGNRICLDCYAVNNRVRSIRRVVQAYQTSNPCVRCGKFFPHEVMEFKYPTGRRQLASLIHGGSTPETVLKNLRQWQLFCANCRRLDQYAEAAELPSNRTNRQKRLQEFIREAKENKACMDCQEKFFYVVMEFDHLRDKKFNIGNAPLVSLKRLREEIAKCDLVCANCHRMREERRRQDKKVAL